MPTKNISKNGWLWFVGGQMAGKCMKRNTIFWVKKSPLCRPWGNETKKTDCEGYGETHFFERDVKRALGFEGFNSLDPSLAPSFTEFFSMNGPNPQQKQTHRNSRRDRSRLCFF